MIQIKVGEIKSDKDRGKALIQLLKRLCIVVGHATRVIFGGEVLSDLQGEIFTPSCWNQFLEEEVQKGLTDHHLNKAPADGRIHIKIINLS
jgi:hypothetical protein